jgi:signal transduction histidine kinase
VVESADGVPRIYFSYPILSDEDGQARTFEGVIVASANPLTVGQYLKNQLSPETSNTVGLMTKDATILYSADEKLIGKDYYGEEFQTQLPDGLKQDFNGVIDRSLRSTGLSQASLSYEGNSGSITSVPIAVDGASFGILYLVAPYTLANETQQILDSQTAFTIFFIGALTAVAIAAALSVLKWNKSLQKLVARRTAELEDSNRSLGKALDDLTVHDRMQKEFINIAAHELRTPIQPILSMAEIAEADNTSETGSIGKEVVMQREDFEMILRNARRLERLSSDILEVARIESNALKLHKETFDLNEKIQKVVRDMKSRPLDGKDIEIVFEQTGGPILIHADKSKIYEVISNLVGNAVKFTPHNGKVSITVRNQEELVISVNDTGPGVDPEIVPNLFTKFVTKSFTGTGLGLYISKAIVEAHGGRIWAENNSNGSTGARFSFTLPAAKEGNQGELLASEGKMM